VPIKASNLQIIEINIEDKKRLKSFGKGANKPEINKESLPKKDYPISSSQKGKKNGQSKEEKK